jgi:methylated-DNA-[protein]-cysteine S-methyltransferase
MEGVVGARQMRHKAFTFQRFIRHPLTGLYLEGRLTGRGGVIVTATGLVGWQRGAIDDDGVKSRAVERVVECLEGYLAGSVHDLGSIRVDLGWATPFQGRVVRTARRIAWGHTVTYGELAARAGFPGAARAAASVMRANRFPLIVPCHRVVAAGGIGGFMGARWGAAVALKKRLLAHEGVEV